SDRTSIHFEKCACGRTMARMDRILKRTDQMVNVRGINIFPEKVQEALAHFAGIGPGHSMAVTEKNGLKDQIAITVEAAPEILGMPEEKKNPLRERIELALRRTLGLRVAVELGPAKT
ncbi:MAG: phenylacetate--CoA ligase, partial [Deltaproteobacteria bacterium]|nr:phenylacetate--CoA ligase [Deltaproteobacteria bacterium]